MSVGGKGEGAGRFVGGGKVKKVPRTDVRRGNF